MTNGTRDITPTIMPRRLPPEFVAKARKELPPKKGTGQDHVGLIGPEDGGDSDGSKKKKLMDETIYNFERNKTDQTEKMRLTFRIRIRDYKLCQILADSRGISASHVVRMALSEYFQRQDIENEICAKLQRNSTAE